MDYFRTIVYPEYVINGESRDNTSYVKVECRDDTIILNVVVTGVCSTQRLTGGLLLGSGLEEYALGTIKIENGFGRAFYTENIMQLESEMPFPLSNVDRICIDLGSAGMLKGDCKLRCAPSYQRRVLVREELMDDVTVQETEESRSEAPSLRQSEEESAQMRETEEPRSGVPSLQQNEEEPLQIGEMCEIRSGAPGLQQNEEEPLQIGEMCEIRSGAPGLQQSEEEPLQMGEMCETRSGAPGLQQNEEVFSQLRQIDEAQNNVTKYGEKSGGKSGKDSCEEANGMKKESMKADKSTQIGGNGNSEKEWETKEWLRELEENARKRIARIDKPRRENCNVIMEEKWKQLWMLYPHITPFKDDREYIRFSPTDFVVLPQESYRKANNSFLLHGFFNYKHLLLGRTNKQGEIVYYVGVPGSYYDKEKQVAVMFGFESFECAEEPAQIGDFGYYMLRVNL